jgi:hypothetical protein
MKEFKTAAGNHRQFAIDDEVFNCASDLTGGAALQLSALVNSKDSEKVHQIGQFLDLVLLPEDAVRFAARMRDTTRPVTIAMLGQILQWVLEEYSERPTQQPTPSSAGLSTNGTDLTDGAALEEWTPPPFPQHVSST